MLRAMYAPFFGLQQEPFSIAPDPRYLYMSERHREALAHLVYGLGGGGFVLLTGEIGAGKTTVCRCWLEQIPANCNVAYIFNPRLSALELLRTVCDEFHIEVPDDPPPSIKDHVDRINGFLLRMHAVGHASLLIIDEAQQLSPEVLEQLRLLTNLETNERKLLQIVLIGQPELRGMLARPELEQLAQRVIARYHLEALSPAETEQYLRHRLTVAGLTGPLPFDRAALRRIHRLSRGVPRRINLLADRALLGAYTLGRTAVGRTIVDQAAAEVFDDGSASRRWPWQRRPAAKGAGPGLGRLGAAVLGAGLLGGLAGVGLMTIGQGGLGGTFDGGSSTAAGATQAAATTEASVRSEDTGQAGRAAGVGGEGGAAQAGAAEAANPLTKSMPTPPADGGTGRGANLAVDGGRSMVGPGNASTAASDRSASQPLAGRPDGMAREPTSPWFATEADAWWALAPGWQLAAEGGDPCEAALRQQVHCWRARTTLAVIRQLDRPGVLTLQGEDGRPVFALLTGLDGEAATLSAGGTSRRLPLAELAGLWRGDFATFWRAPAGYAGRAVDERAAPLPGWLAQRLDAAASRSGTASAASPITGPRVAAFQLAHGLQPDGLAGPTTLMQLNRATGVPEPRLAAGGGPR